MTYLENNISAKRINSQDTDLFDNGVVDITASRPYGNLFFPFLIDSGGGNEISITIDTVTKKDIRNDYPNSKWIKNPNKSDETILDSNLLWVFKEAASQNRTPNNMFNAFCFCGQKLNIKISKEGHTSGLFNDEWIYCKNNISLYLTDVVNGTRVLIKTFEDFDIDLDDASRIFEIQIPEENVSVDQLYGVFGMLVLTMEITSTFYYDSSFTLPADIDVNSTKQSHLQILTYSAKKEAKDGVNALSSEISIFEEALLGSETFDELFEKSSFHQFDGIDNKPLNSDQKRAVIADQIAVLFISQHPVVSSDYYPSKVLGFGCEATEKPVYANELIKNVSKRHPELIPAVKNRLYGMLCTYQSFAFASEIDSYFNSLDGSTQSIRDPARVISMSQTDNLETSFGIDGIAFNPYVLECVNAEIPKETDVGQEFSIKLANNSIDIDDIAVLDENGDPISPSAEAIDVSFNVVRGDEIKRIRYSMWTHGNLIWMEYIDETGDSRECRFNLNGTSLTTGDIINIRIDIEDGAEFVNTFYKDIFVPSEKYSPAILNVSAIQNDIGDGQIWVYYNYMGSSEINNTIIKSYYSFDNSTWSEIVSNTVGDVGLGVMPGYKKFNWYPWNTIPSITKQIYIKVSLDDVDSFSNNSKWQDKSVVIQMSISKPSVAIRRLNTDEILEMTISSSSSSTSSSSTSSSTSSDSSLSSVSYSSSTSSSSSL